MSLDTTTLTIEKPKTKEKPNLRSDLVMLQLLKPENVSEFCVCDRAGNCELYDPKDWYCNILGGFHYGTDVRGDGKGNSGCFSPLFLERKEP
ncbi:hypothetical protein HOD75_01930 [archaeon]|jgi:hypothetical protein|nr:hypothetical protein [archaeon]MBT4241636.1 hypothetical protein [archaeon]MBT4418031.1 hypothetical protein [archaeon]